MNFPDILDREDMKLARKEWRLAGYITYENSCTNEGLVGRKCTGIQESRDGGRSVSTIALYIQSRQGYWILVPHPHREWWEAAIRYADIVGENGIS